MLNVKWKSASLSCSLYELWAGKVHSLSALSQSLLGTIIIVVSALQVELAHIKLRSFATFI